MHIPFLFLFQKYTFSKINQTCLVKGNKLNGKLELKSCEETWQCECKTLGWCWPLGNRSTRLQWFFKGVRFGCMVSERQTRGSAFLCKSTNCMLSVSQLVIQIKWISDGLGKVMEINWVKTHDWFHLIIWASKNMHLCVTEHQNQGQDVLQWHNPEQGPRGG